MGKTAFRPEQHGFAFVNSWALEIGEKEEMRKQVGASADKAARTLSANIGGQTFGLNAVLRSAVSRLLDDALPDYYGLCGGMAFAAADHFRAGRPLPRGEGYGDVPRNDNPRGRAIRSYLWRRQLESLGPNAPTLLAWMAMLHLPLPFAGPGWALQRTREEFAELRAHIDRNEPWPLCLIGSSASPFNNHQVLAYGYDDPGDGTATVFVYDMNCPGRENTLRLDMRGAALKAEESCSSPDRGRLQGFFCEHYVPEAPPDLGDR